jgi:superfamily II DNA or RNA helicase
LATGLGKTAIMANVHAYLPEMSKRGVLVIAHRTELVEQAVKQFKEWAPHLRIGVEQGREKVKDLSQVTREPGYHSHVMYPEHDFGHTF